MIKHVETGEVGHVVPKKRIKLELPDIEQGDEIQKSPMEEVVEKLLADLQQIKKEFLDSVELARDATEMETTQGHIAASDVFLHSTAPATPVAQRIHLRKRPGGDSYVMHSPEASGEAEDQKLDAQKETGAREEPATAPNGFPSSHAPVSATAQKIHLGKRPSGEWYIKDSSDETSGEPRVKKTLLEDPDRLKVAIKELGRQKKRLKAALLKIQPIARDIQPKDTVHTGTESSDTVEEEQIVYEGPKILHPGVSTQLRKILSMLDPSSFGQMMRVSKKMRDVCRGAGVCVIYPAKCLVESSGGRINISLLPLTSGRRGRLLKPPGRHAATQLRQACVSGYAKLRIDSVDLARRMEDGPKEGNLKLDCLRDFLAKMGVDRVGVVDPSSLPTLHDLEMFIHEFRVQKLVGTWNVSPLHLLKPVYQHVTEEHRNRRVRAVEPVRRNGLRLCDGQQSALDNVQTQRQRLQQNRPPCRLPHHSGQGLAMWREGHRIDKLRLPLRY